MKVNIKRVTILFAIVTLTISLFFINYDNVKGKADGNGTNYPGGSLGACGGSNCIWSGEVGVRFSLVDENGNQVSGTRHIDGWVKSKIYKSRFTYDLYDNDSNLLWNFDGAWYGDQIKQDVLDSRAGLTYGDYWNTSNIVDLESLFPKGNMQSLYSNRWEGGWIQKIADYIIANTSNDDTKIMDDLLIAMNYKEGSAAASAAGYFIQYEPVIHHGRIGRDITNYIFIGSITEYMAYDREKAGLQSPHFVGLNTTGVYIYKDGEGEAPTNFTKGVGSGVSNLLSRDGNGKIYGEGVAHIWIRDLIDPPSNGCSSLVTILNDWYQKDKLSQTEYDAYIAQIIDGTLAFKDEETNTEYKIDKTYDFEFLIKANYDKYNEGLAACANREKVSLDCEKAIEYINLNYRRGTQAYHDAVDQVEAGTFSYEDYDGSTKTIDKAYSYNMLDKKVYTKHGGVAQCNDVDVPSCVGGDPAVVNIDECETGKTFFGDVNDEESWLVCEIAYSNAGKIYSSDNTGHEAVETTDGGIVGNAEYCEVFCYEEFETTFPTHVYDVKAGQTFTWGTIDGTFGTVKVRKKCSNQNYVKGQQGYRFEEWEEDYKDNEEAMIEHFMKNGAYEEALDSIYISSTGWRYTCDRVCTTRTSSVTGKTYTTCRYTACPEWRATARSTSQSEDYSHGYIGNVVGSVGSKSCQRTSMSSQSDANSNAISCLEGILKNAAASEEAQYSQKKNEEAELIEKIEQCTNNIKYVHKATVQFTFKEPVNSVYGANSRSFEFNDDLIVEGNFNESNVDTSKCTKKTIYKYSCSGYASGVTCTPEAKEVWNCTVVTWDITGNYTYKYPVEEFQWYSLKIDSTLLNEKDKGSEDEAFFYSIGFGLPTALSLTDGTYELKTVVYDLGDDAEFSGGNPQYERPEDTHFDPLGLPVDTNNGSKKGFEYICTYEVDNEIFGYDCQYDESGKLIYSSPKYCDDDKDDDSDGSLLGIDITYRLVTLLSDGDSVNKAFPGKDGNGRMPGGNWSIGDMEIHNILDADVYNDPAMYEIMLDVNAIQKIRKDNQTYFNSGKDPYASYYDANNNQKVYCAEEGDQKYCASDFISDLYNGSGLNYRLLGTCLPTGNTLERAEEVLENGCETHYTYPTINWTR